LYCILTIIEGQVNISCGKYMEEDIFSDELGTCIMHHADS